MINKPRLQKLLEAIEELQTKPELWKQDTWKYQNPCGTKYCMAGYYIHKNPDCGLHFYPLKKSLADKSATMSGITIPGGSCLTSMQVIEDLLSDHFGITKYQSVVLFDFIATFESSIKLIKELLNETTDTNNDNSDQGLRPDPAATKPQPIN